MKEMTPEYHDIHLVSQTPAPREYTEAEEEDILGLLVREARTCRKHGIKHLTAFISSHEHDSPDTFHCLLEEGEVEEIREMMKEKGFEAKQRRVYKLGPNAGKQPRPFVWPHNESFENVEYILAFTRRDFYKKYRTQDELLATLDNLLDFTKSRYALSHTLIKKEDLALLWEQVHTFVEDCKQFIEEQEPWTTVEPPSN